MCYYWSLWLVVAITIMLLMLCQQKLSFLLLDTVLIKPQAFPISTKSSSLQIYYICCSNYSSLKDKWSHNKQSSPMGYQVKSGGITRELNKKPLLHYSSIYTITSWSVLQQCVYLMSIHHTSTLCPITHPHVFSLRPPCFLHVPWCHTFNLHYTCAYYMYTMRNPCPLTSFLTLTPSRLFLILLDLKSF